MQVTRDLLKAFPLLKSLPDEALDELARQSSASRYARRAIVLNAGANQEGICFLFEGRLQGVDFTVDGREVGLYFVEPADFCGELTLFDQGEQPEFVIALTASVVVSIPPDALRDVMLSNPQVMAEVGIRLAARVRQLTRQRSLLGLPNIAQRVCYQLWMLVPESHRKSEQGVDGASEIRNPPTHMELAIMLNVSRETVTRVFQSLQNRQIVKRDGPSRLQLTDLGALKRFAEGDEEL